MTQWPDFESEDRRLRLKMRFWIGLAAALLGFVSLTVGWFVEGKVHLLAVLGVVVGTPLAVASRRQLRGQGRV